MNNKHILSLIIVMSYLHAMNFAAYFNCSATCWRRRKFLQPRWHFGYVRWVTIGPRWSTGGFDSMIMEFPISSVLQSVLTTGLKLAVAELWTRNSRTESFMRPPLTLRWQKNEKYSVCQAHRRGLFIAHELNWTAPPCSVNSRGGGTCPRARQGKGRKTASLKIFYDQWAQKYYSLLNEPKVAYRNKLLLFVLPTCLGISYSTT